MGRLRPARKIPFYISIVLIIMSILVLYGLSINNEILKTGIQNGAPMKPAIAMSILLSSLCLMLLSVTPENNQMNIGQEFTVFLFSTFVILLVLVLATAPIFDSYVSDENSGGSLPDGNRLAGINDIGIPTLGEVLVLTLFNIAMISIILSDGMDFAKKFLGGIVALTGATGILGYLVNVPVLYFRLGIWQDGMAFNTAVAILLLGIGLVSMGDVKNGI